MLKGALHAHSTFSDGEFTLAEIRRLFLSESCSFVCMTDHAEYFDQESIERYIAECESLSDKTFCLVAGLEYRCERNMHILGYAATSLTQTSDPQDVIRHIDGQNAVSVIAHPRNDSFSWIEGFQTMPQGIEVWNTKYDGRYAPRAGTFHLLERMRQRAPQMHAFYGQDLHWKKQYRGLHVTLDCPSPQPTAILSALAAGNFVAHKDNLDLPSSGIVPESLLVEFNRVHARSERMWRFIKNSKQTLDRLGIKVPESLKRQLRRIF